MSPVTIPTEWAERFSPQERGRIASEAAAPRSISARLWSPTAHRVEIMSEFVRGALGVFDINRLRCWPLHVFSSALALLGALLVWQPATSLAQSSCETYRITGYVRGHHSPWTYDGTSVWTSEAIAAASWNVPINSIVHVDGLGSFRIADRGGGLGTRHIDILVDSVAEARALTGWRSVCILKSGNVKKSTASAPTPKKVKPTPAVAKKPPAATKVTKKPVATSKVTKPGSSSSASKPY